MEPDLLYTLVGIPSETHCSLDDKIDHVDGIERNTNLFNESQNITMDIWIVLYSQ